MAGGTDPLFYEFDDFSVDTERRLLMRSGQPISLTPKVFDTLLVLIQYRGEILDKDRLMHELWSDSFVEEANIAQNVAVLRRTLGEKAKENKFIATVTGRGYRFVAKVREVNRRATAGSAAEFESEDSSRNASVREFPLLVRRTDLRSANSALAVAPAPKLGSGQLNEDANSDLRLVSNSAIGKGKWSLPTAVVICLVVISISVVGTLIYRYGTSARNAVVDQPKAEDKTPILARPFSSEPLSSNGNTFTSTISPNGKQVAYVSRQTNGLLSLWIRDLETGSNVEVIPAATDIYLGIDFSPDSSQLYFARASKYNEPAVIYRTAIFGGIPRKVVSDAEGSFSISRDGASISFFRCPKTVEENCSLWSANVNGTNERRLVTRPVPYRIADNKFSPDGKNIAFAAGQSRNMGNDFGLYLVSAEGGPEKEVTGERFFNIKSIVWLPDGENLLITALKFPDQIFRIWRVSIADGSVAPLTNDVQYYDYLSIDRDGERLIATTTRGDASVHVISSATDEAISTIDSAIEPNFGPSGKLYFSSSRSGNNDIWSANGDGKQFQQLTTDRSDDRSPVADADHIYFASNRTGEMQIWRMAVDGNDVEQFTTQNGGIPLALSADSKWLYYLHAIDRTLWRITTDSRVEEKVIDKPKSYFAVSRSARYVAFEELVNGKVSVLINDLDSRDSRPAMVFDVPGQAVWFAAAWKSDESALLIAVEDNKHEKHLMLLRVADGMAQDLPLGNIDQLGDLTSIATSIDGNRFAIAVSSWMHDAVLIHGLH